MGEESQEKKERIHTSHGDQAPLEAETVNGVEQERGRGFMVKRERGRKGGKIGRVGGDVTIRTAEELVACESGHQHFGVRVSLNVPHPANEVIARWSYHQRSCDSFNGDKFAGSRHKAVSSQRTRQRVFRHAKDLYSAQLSSFKSIRRRRNNGNHRTILPLFQKPLQQRWRTNLLGAFTTRRRIDGRQRLQILAICFGLH